MANSNNRLTIIALLAVLLLAVGIGTRLSIRAMSPVPTKLGVFYGSLKPCRDKPNCVSSQAANKINKIEPIMFVGTDRPTAYRLLSEVIEGLPRAHVLVSRVDYIHVEFHSLVFGFRDDTELWIDDTAGRIEVRSASRIGKNDGGVNRRRVEEIRGRFNEKLRTLLKG